jgi:hypothetical protein
MFPWKTYTKLPLLRGADDHLPAFSSGAFHTSQAIDARTSLTIESDKRARIACSDSPISEPPPLSTVTSVRSGVGGAGGVVTAGAFAGWAAAFEYEAGVRFIWRGVEVGGVVVAGVAAA